MLSSDVIHIVTSKLIEVKYSVVRFLLLRRSSCTSYTSVEVLLACCLSKERAVVMLVLMKFRNADTKSETSVHPYSPS